MPRLGATAAREGGSAEEAWPSRGDEADARAAATVPLARPPRADGEGLGSAAVVRGMDGDRKRTQSSSSRGCDGVATSEVDCAVASGAELAGDA